MSQAIVIYLFVQFSRPQSFTKDKAMANESASSSDEFEEQQDDKLNMLLYIQSMPKMVKSGVTLHIDPKKSALEQLFEADRRMS